MRSRMNGRSIFLTLAIVAVMGLSALAQSAVSQKITFMVDGKIGTENVKKGTYNITYTDAETGTIEIKVGGKVLSIPFTRRASENEASADRVTYKELEDGSRGIATITPRGKNFTLILDTTETSVAKKK